MRQGQQGSGGDKRQLNKVQEEVRGKDNKAQEEIRDSSTRFRMR